MIHGKRLKPLSFDPRDFSHEKTFGTAAALPQTLGRKPIAIHDQGTSDYCTAFATSEAGGFLAGMDMSPEYQAAKEGQVAGSPIFNGTDPRTALSAASTYGFLPQDRSTHSFQKEGWQIPAEWQQWDASLDQVAAQYKSPYYSVTPTFDGIKQALYQAKDDNGVVTAFGFWYPEWNTTTDGIAPVPTSSQPFRHAYIFIDWTTIGGVEYLVAQLSQGPDFGDKGVIYFSREVIAKAWANPVWNGIGCYIFRKDQGQTNEAIQVSLYTQLIAVLAKIVAILKQQEGMDNGITFPNANAQKLYEAAKASIGQAIAPPPLAEFGCAITVNRIHAKAFGKEINPGPSDASTYSLWKALSNSPLFARISAPEPGCIVISPTGLQAASSPLQNGHTGIVGQYGIMSNQSSNGRWEENYTLKSWQDHFATYGKFPVYYFRRL